ncbi:MULTISPECIES: GTPase family protein [unclassified Nocardioides]|uniref:GTPase family protein n=1 Tax=unclassified Nocardioides TaxID=2615069 RepID=UPI00360BE284
MAKPADEWFGQAFGKAWKDEAEEIGRFNLAIFGKTGVGKSTLVNAIFGEEIAATGIGEPVTRAEHLYLHRSGTLGVLDTRGVEVGRDNAQLINELRDYLHGMRRKPLAEQVHVAWYCVRAGDRRFEATEGDFIRALHELGLPVILVLTQVPRSVGPGGGSRVHPDAEALAASIAALDLPIQDGLIHYTMARDDEFTGQTAYGLQELLDATFRGAPSGVAHAITAAQRIDFDRKRERAEAAIKVATGAATTAGASPIPFSDAAILVPLQLTMMASIAVTYGISIERSTAASIAATAAATTAGRSLVGNLIKFVPGAGTAVAGTINAGVAGTFTFAMGHAWLRVCERLARGELRTVGGALDSDRIHRVFMDEFKSLATRGRKAS